ncbi:DUF4838 domain-containing protein [Phycisphaerales bacterium AB-hyl4]|uniref:DUF4838 domain-containing protein n=1 Tax=Natronomicrosphaera hydrolytica TaxID=3242702 RepID=A0ABV4U8U0_9BACT
MTLVDRGEARVVVVVADEPTAISLLAVDELVLHVEKATGVTLPVARESSIPDGYGSRLYLGNTKAAAAQGIDSESMEPDAFLLRTVEADLYVVGREDGLLVSKPVMYGTGSYGYSGTLFGVYEVLERYVGVRWLWPGDLGTYVPRTKAVVIDSLDEMVRMKLQRRQFGVSWIRRAVENYSSRMERIAFSEDGLRNYARDLEVYLRRHRVGGDRSHPYVDHRFHDWWSRYGKEHPEWFMMNKAGERTGPALCVSNPDLHRFIVDQAWDGSAEDRWHLNIGEVDVRVYCQCETCLEWDRPQPKGFAEYSTSNRYARFWKAVRDLAVERNPKALPKTFLYMNYTHAPTIDIDLSGIYGEFVPWFSGFNPYYPMPDREHAYLKQQWRDWSRTGITMAYRPNYLLGGYVLPHLSTWQAGDMFQFAYRHGMVGHYYDSLWGQWAVRGPMYYIHMRLSADPEADIEVLREEFFSSFGPAAKEVEAYFNYWESYSRHEAPRGGVDWHDPRRAHMAYPPEVFGPAERILDRAMSAARESASSEFSERVEFLQSGLKHTRLSLEFIGTLGHQGAIPRDDKERFRTVREAMERLVQFRRAHEHMYIADYVAAATIEMNRIDLDVLYEAFEDVRVDAASDSAEMPWGQWYFRKDEQGVGIKQEWFIADLDKTSKGIQQYDDGGVAYLIDRQYWMPVRVPARLSETPAGDYLGYGWYVTTFNMPKLWTEQSVRLRFEGVDEQAWVYVNGKMVGEHTVESENKPVEELWDRPFEIEVASESFIPNGENLLVVRIHASSGAAGIWGPVQVYVMDAEPAD